MNQSSNLEHQSNEALRRLILKHFKEKPKTRDYKEYQAKHPELPTYYQLVKAFGSWQAVSKEVWGVEESRKPMKWDVTSAINYIQTIYPDRLTSTAYREQMKLDPKLPTHTKILKHFKNWDTFTNRVWGVGGYIQTWDSEKIKQAIYQLSPTLITSHQYLKLRNTLPATERQQYPTYAMILKFFNSWEELSQAVWESSCATRKFWTSRDEVIERIKAVFPEPITSSYYVDYMKEHKEVGLPSFPVVQRWFKTWHEATYQIWGILLPIWTKETMLSAVVGKVPERISSRAYCQMQVEDKTLPNYPMIQKYFGNWKAFSEELWGEYDQWTQETAIEAIRWFFEEKPTRLTYKEITKGQQGQLILPTIHYCEKLFGSWNHAMEIAFSGKPLSFKPTEKKSHLTDEELIQVMRRAFKQRPSYLTYQEKSRRYHWLPNVKTYANRFGSWEIAMIHCYPNEKGFNQGKVWEASEALACLKRAYTELGEALSPTTYQSWQKEQQRAPALNTINRLFGSFAEATALFGYEASFIRQWHEEEIHVALTNYFNSFIPDETKVPSIYDYLAKLEEKQMDLPSITRVRNTYGSWRQAVKVHCPFIQEDILKDYELKQTRENCLKSLQLVYQEIGDPFTRTRYEYYRQERSVLGQELASAYQIRVRLGSWKEALEVAGIQYFHYTNSEALFRKQLDSANLDSNSLEDFLDWCLN